MTSLNSAVPMISKESLLLIQKRTARRRYGTKYQLIEDQHEHTHNDAVWGWDGRDMIPEDIQDARNLNKSN